jgi:hypothetical protein
MTKTGLKFLCNFSYLNGYLNSEKIDQYLMISAM